MAFIDFTGFYRVFFFLSAERCHLIGPNVFGFQQILPSFTGFYRVFLGAERCNLIGPSVFGFQQILPSFTGF